MKPMIYIMLLLLSFFSSSCSKVSPDAVDLNVDFNWQGLVPCTPGGNPEIRIGGIPADTDVLVVRLYDHGMSHGKQFLYYDGSGVIRQGALDKIEGPCPAIDSGKYRFKIEAVNAKKVIIGIGSKERYFPEEE